jgi:RHS repeat-associated protein
VITDMYTTATSTDWVMAAITLRPATSTSAGAGTSSGSTTVRFVHTDTLGGTSVVTDAQGAVAQAEDFYPYGATRIDTKSGGYGGEKRKYAGTEYDALSGLNYMQARYQSPQRGQLLSQDPVFLGNPAQQNLKDPQSMNSYSYANDNPITKSDPNGKYVEISGSLVAPGRAWSAGIRFDSNGIDYFLSGGVGIGLSAGFEAMWAPGVALSHTNQASLSANGTVADGLGGRLSQNIWTYDPVTKKTIPNGDRALGLVFGAGAGASVQLEASAPMPYFVWNRPTPPSLLYSP